MNLTVAGIGIAGGRFDDIYWSLNSMTYIANNSQPIPRRFITKHQRERSPADENGILLPSLSLPAHTFSFLHHRFLRSRTPNHQQYSIGRHACIKRDLKPNDFDPREKFWSQFPSEGSNITPTHQSSDFWWKAYFPVVFRHLRELFQVDPADFMLAICGTDALRELSSPGKSGSSFHLTQDDKFMIKTVKKSEVKNQQVIIRRIQF